MPVVEGEDTESDEEEVQPESSEQGRSLVTPAAQGGTVVSGEASETDDDEEDEISSPVVDDMTLEPESKSGILAGADIRGKFKEFARKRNSVGTPTKRAVKRDPRFER